MKNIKKNIDISKLTDQDILDMEESEYMNALQLEYFKNKLLANEQEILDNAKKTTQTFQEQETNYIADPSDRATIEEEYALELRTRDRENYTDRTLADLYDSEKIRKALYLLETGEYGYCEDTGEPIGVKRLLARPTATLTIEAQERREKMQKHFAEE